MQAILRSRIPGKRNGGTPTRIEVSFVVPGEHPGNDREARKLAMAKFRELFGDEFADVATGPRAIWSIEVM